MIYDDLVSPRRFRRPCSFPVWCYELFNHSFFLDYIEDGTESFTEMSITNYQPRWHCFSNDYNLQSLVGINPHYTYLICIKNGYMFSK
jgi:hypothetical protein